MKSLRYLSIVLFVAIPLPRAMADSTKSVMVTNNTTYTMSEFYASSSDSSSWDTSNNLLAGKTVAPGQAATIVISDSLETCNYDLMAVLYGATQHAYQYRVNACDEGSWTISTQ